MLGDKFYAFTDAVSLWVGYQLIAEPALAPNPSVPPKNEHTLWEVPEKVSCFHHSSRIAFKYIRFDVF